MVISTVNARSFYKIFVSNFSPDHNESVREAYPPNSRDLNGGEWTFLMGRFLTDLMDKEGFGDEYRSKEVGILGKRVDFKWQKENFSVFIEIENDKSKVMCNEVKNLLNSDGDLRVLITYDKSEKSRADLKNHILGEIKQFKSGRNFEFLLIIGTDEYMTDYDLLEGYRFFPSFDVEKIK